jgi:hypothetical protein
VVYVHTSVLCVMTPCTLVGGYHLSEQQTASIFRVEVLLIWSRCPLSSGYIPHYNHCLPFACIYRVSQEECAILRESVPYVKLYRYNPKHLYPELNGYGDNGQRSLKL